MIKPYLNNFQGETLYIIACGPSLGKVNQEKLLHVCQNNHVMTVKQAFGVVGQFANFHHFNCNNFSKYNFSESWTIGSATVGLDCIKKSLWGSDTRVDSFFKIDIKNRLSQTLDFGAQFDTDNQTKLWGPGILFETCFPVAFAAGFTRIRLLGVDLAPRDYKKRSYCHFYDNVEKINGPTGSLTGWENNEVIDMCGHLYGYLKKRNIQLDVLSRESHLSDNIPRDNFLYD